jgi:tetratricopeptide (TPR) repeat protein
MRQQLAASVDRGRREFLIRFCQGASAAFLPAGLRNFAFRDFASRRASAQPDISGESGAEPGAYSLHPQYRTQRPLDALLLKVKAGSDEFVTEKFHDQIAATLANWSAALRSSVASAAQLERNFTSAFSGFTIKPVDSRIVRTGPLLEVRQMHFGRSTAQGKDQFLQDLRSSFSDLSQIFTADFQVTKIAASSDASSSAIPARLETRIHYEIVGTGKDFYREQRNGQWDLEWESSSGQFLIRSWKPIEETRSRTIAPVYADISESALAGNPSYAAQILHGTDYWRTVLDGACGINIYGHNGVSVGDIDNDGLDDLYVCQPGGLPNRLYRNRGNGTFEDITDAAGVGVLDETACALFADFDNDGHQDLIVVRASGPLLFENQGNGKFLQKPEAFKFAIPPQGTFTGAAIADYDRDGWLDVYFCLYVYYRGADQYKYPLPYYAAENGPPNFMMRNNRDGTFRDVTPESGLNQNNTRYSFCCGWSDYNSDGWPDLYVVNDFGRKNLYRNNGDGTFTDVASQAGVEDVGAGMSVCWLDYDKDGAQDLYVANMWTAAGERISTQDVFQKNSTPEIRAQYHKHAMGNSLFRNRGPDAHKNAFQDETKSSGTGMGRWAWSSDAWDFDHDGFPDLYITNGMISGPSREDLNSFFWRQVVAHSPGEPRPSHEYEEGWNAINELIRADGTWSGYERNVFYANNRDGTFSDVSGAVGLDFIEDGRAFALTDFDGDGRQEIFLKNRNGPQLRILKNVVKTLPPSIAFCLRGIKSNRDAIGASLTIETSAGKQTRMLQAGSGFLSQHSKQILFGLGDAIGTVQASIAWPSGLVQQLKDLPPDHVIWVEEGREPVRLEAFKPTSQRSIANGEHLPGATQPPRDEAPEAIETWLLAPVAAPDFTLNDFAGRTWTLTESRGKIVLLHFWSSKMRNWQESLNSIERIGKHLGAQAKLCTLNIDGEDGNAVQSWIRNRHFSFPILRATDDIAAIYNLLYRQMFDRHRDMPLPASFLVDGKGQIVKVYQGAISFAHIENDVAQLPVTPEERLAKALPFPGLSSTFEFERNNLSYGSVFFQRGYMDQAAAFFRQALRDDPSSAEALYGLGSAYLNQEKTAEAKESFAGATKLHASYPDTLPNAWNNLGLLSAREGKTDEAIEYFQKALELNPSLFVALENLGNAYRQQKSWDKARDTLQKALVVNSADPEANYGLGMVFAQTDDTEHAYEYLRKAIELRPVYPEALNNLGVLYLRTRRPDEAVAIFEECIRNAPDFEQSYFNLAQVYALENQPAKARNVLQQLLNRHPDSQPAQKALQQLSR